MDMLNIDAEALFSTADAIYSYCAKQREILNVYYAQVMALESEWQDDETFGGIVEEIRILRSQTLAVIEAVQSTYPNFFREKAQQINARPKINAQGATPIKVIEEVRVPSSKSQYYRNYSGASYNGGLRVEPVRTPIFGKRTGGTVQDSTPSGAVAVKTDSGYIKRTFAVAGNSPRLSAVLQSSFANAPQGLMEGVYRTTDRLEFAESTKGSYYAPCGAYSGANKSAICVDYSSPDLSDEIVSLVGQHMFYHADDGDYFDMIEALKKEGNDPSLAENARYQEYLNTFRAGVYVPEDQNDERLSKKSYKTAARFFAECFSANVRQEENVKEDLKKMFPESYNIAMSIIEKQADSLTFGGN